MYFTITSLIEFHPTSSQFSLQSELELGVPQGAWSRIWVSWTLLINRELWPRHGFWYVCTVILTLEIWPWPWHRGNISETDPNLRMNTAEVTIVVWELTRRLRRHVHCGSGDLKYSSYCTFCILIHWPDCKAILVFGMMLSVCLSVRQFVCLYVRSTNVNFV